MLFQSIYNKMSLVKWSPKVIKVSLLVSMFITWTVATSIENLTVDQKQKYDQFKERVKGNLTDDYMKSDFYLLRWMEAKTFNAEQAEKMLLDTLEWRKANQMDSILEEDFSDISEKFWANTETQDKVGRPVSLANLGSWPIRDGVVSGNQARILRWIDHFQESSFQNVVKARETGKNVTGIVFLVDLTGFNKVQLLCPACVPLVVKFVDGLEAHYPFLVSELILINAPPSFTRILSATKNAMSANTNNVMKVLDQNKEKWMAYLDERIDREQRFENFGGTRKLKDE